MGYAYPHVAIDATFWISLVVLTVLFIKTGLLKGVEMRNWIDGDYIDDDDFDTCDCCGEKITDKNDALLAFTRTGDVLCTRCHANAVESETWQDVVNNLAP